MRNETITVLLRAFLTDLLFPRRCPVCGDIVLPRGELICPACVKKLSFVKQPVCKKVRKGDIQCREGVLSGLYEA